MSLLAKNRYNLGIVGIDVTEGFMRIIIGLLALSLLSPSQILFGQNAEAHLTGKIANYTGLFKEDKKLRHNRYEASMRQTVNFGLRLKTVAEGRLWWDPVLMDSRSAVRRNYPKAVRDDELFEGEARQVYLDYLGDVFKLKIGRQYFDWSNSLYPSVLGVMTPMDTRFGLSLATGDGLIPVEAFDLRHDFLFGGTLEYILIPWAKTHRLAKAENGYGFYEKYQTIAAGRILEVEDEQPAKSAKEMEYGGRYLLSLTEAGIDLAILAFHGHQRSPAYEIESTPTTLEITQVYPQVNTYGLTLTYGNEGFVGRVMTYYEPRRGLSHSSQFITPQLVRTSCFERRTIFGAGLDYVFNDDLKFYSEHYWTKTERKSPDNPTPEERAIEGSETNYTGLIRLSSEVIDDFEFNFDGILTSPKRGYMLGPSIDYDLTKDTSLGVGAKLITAKDDDSALATIEDSSQYFVRLQSNFNIAQWGVDSD